MRIPKSTVGKILAGAAIVLVATSGTAYAVATITSADIVDETIRTVDIKDETIKGADILNGTIRTVDVLDGSLTTDDIADGSLTTADILDGTLTTTDIADGTITTDDIASETLTSADLATDSVNATEVADNSIDAGEIVDFGLTNEDIGVLEAEVNADGTLASSDHFGTTSTLIGTGTYQVDFGINVSFCTPVATQGEAGVGSAGGAILGVTDRSGNANAFFVTTRNTANAVINTAFHIIVVC
jgi:hypothetical protein